MLHNRIIARPGLTAIAAVLALSSTQLVAQEVGPAATDTTAPVESPPPPAETPSATTSDPLAPEPAAESATTTAAPAATAARATNRRATVTRAQAARPQARPTAAAAPAAATTVAATPAEPAAPIAPAQDPAEQLAAAPMTPDVAPVESEPFMVDMDQALPIAGAAGLALVGFAGIGMAMRRRRRRHAEEDLSYSDAHTWHEPTVARAEPVADPVALQPQPQTEPQTIRANNVAATSSGWTTPSAFSWGHAAPAVAAAAPMAGSSRTESRIDAALRGPTPDNPFLSLKKRLRRAAFFEQRDRAVRDGTAKPLSPMAGLPKAMTDKAANFVRGGSVPARPEMVTA